MEQKIVFRCILCKHYYGHRLCDAFSGNIPDEIFTGENDHSKPHKDQIGKIVFELKKQKRQ